MLWPKRIRLNEEVKNLRAQVETYREAFESTAADRDRCKQELETYRHAFETTAVDRDKHEEASRTWRETVRYVIENPSFARVMSSLDKFPPLQAPVCSRTNAVRPNVICVGMQKTATSFLYSVLRQHPLVAAMEKDTDLLAQFCRSAHSADLQRYFSLTRDIVARPVVSCFEVNVAEVDGSARLIHEYVSERPRIIFCLRHPVDRLVSDYKMRVRGLDRSGFFIETEEFEAALMLDPKRDGDVENPLYYYVDRSRYFHRIKQYCDVFGRENVHVIVMERDLSGSAVGETLFKLFNFLSINDADAVRLAAFPPMEYARISASPKRIDVTLYTEDGTALHNPTELPNSAVTELVIDSDVPQQLSLRMARPPWQVMRAAITMQRRHDVALPPRRRSEIYRSYFAEDVARLEEFLGADLSAWKC